VGWLLNGFQREMALERLLKASAKLTTAADDGSPRIE
jgi:hypothetical protein